MPDPRIALLYALTVLVMGGSWFAIHLQVATPVDPAVSLVWRFLIASALMIAAAAMARVRLRFTAREHRWLALQGLLLFSVNQLLIYLASRGLPSGLVAVVFSTIAVMNAVNGTLFFGEALRPRVLVGGILGVAGMAIIFHPHLAAAGEVVLPFLLLCVAGTACASFGTLLSQRNQRVGMPVLTGTAVSMLYGAAFCALYASLTGKAFIVEASAAYLGSLAYMAVVATALGFWSYLTLVGEIGADRTGYTTVLFPIVALALSTLFEGYVWSPSAGAGLALVLAGNVLAMRGARRAGRPAMAPPVEAR